MQPNTFLLARFHFGIANDRVVVGDFVGPQSGKGDSNLLIVTSPIGSGGSDADDVIFVTAQRRYEDEEGWGGHSLDASLRYIGITRAKKHLFLFIECFRRGEDADQKRPWKRRRTSTSWATPEEAAMGEPEHEEEVDPTAERATARAAPLMRLLRDWNKIRPEDLRSWGALKSKVLENTSAGWSFLAQQARSPKTKLWEEGWRASESYERVGWSELAATVPPVSKYTCSQFFAPENRDMVDDLRKSLPSEVPERPRRKLALDFDLWHPNRTPFPPFQDRIWREWASLVVPPIRFELAGQETVFFSIPVLARFVDYRDSRCWPPPALETRLSLAKIAENFQFDAMGRVAEALRGRRECGRWVGYHKLFEQELRGRVAFYKMCRSERACFSVREGDRREDKYLIECHHGMGLAEMHQDLFSFVFISKDFQALAVFMRLLQEGGARPLVEKSMIFCGQTEPELKERLCGCMISEGVAVHVTGSESEQARRHSHDSRWRRSRTDRHTELDLRRSACER